MRAKLHRRLEAVERRAATVVRLRQEAAIKAMTDEELAARLEAVWAEMAAGPSPYDDMTDDELDQALRCMSAGSVHARS